MFTFDVKEKLLLKILISEMFVKIISSQHYERLNYSIKYAHIKIYNLFNTMLV